MPSITLKKAVMAVEGKEPFGAGDTSFFASLFAIENIENMEETNAFFAFFIDIFEAIASFFKSIFSFIGI